MESSILNSTKKVLGIDDTYVVFDLDVIMFINSAFSNLNQLGIGPTEGFAIEDDSLNWEDLDVPSNWLGMVRSYIYLKVRMLFDPPGTSFHIEAMNKQIQEFEWRLGIFRDSALAAEEV